MEASETIFTEVEPFTGETPPVPVVQFPAAPMLQSKTQYHTAVSVQKPRNLDKVVAAVLREAEFAGDAFYYSYPMGGKKIEGASIGLAMAIAREWGNCAVPVEYYETPSEWVFNAHFVDLERGFTVSRVFRRKKGKGLLGKLGEDRAEDMTFQSAQSRAIRNVVLAGVPRWLVDQAREKAKDSVIKGITREGIALATEKAMKFLAGYGITEDRVVAVLGKGRVEWSSEDIAALRGLASQLKDGQATAEHLFPMIETMTSPLAPKISEPIKERKPRSDRGTIRGPKTGEMKKEGDSPAPPPESPATAPTTINAPHSVGFTESAPTALDQEEIQEIFQYAGQAGKTVKEICEKYQVSGIDEMDRATGNQCLGWLMDLVAEKQE